MFIAVALQWHIMRYWDGVCRGYVQQKNERCGELMAASKLPEVLQLGNSPRPTSALAVSTSQATRDRDDED